MFFREDARRVPLSRFRLHSGERFRYEYEFTADWKLDIRLEQVLPFDPKRSSIRKPPLSIRVGLVLTRNPYDTPECSAKNSKYPVPAFESL
jgi:Plasmid pRiA4b ORF-3-like protein